MDTSTPALPPGQRRVDGFPRFGTHLHQPPPAVPDDPSLAVGGEVTEPLSLTPADLGALPRTEITADLHCVAGWSATGLRWGGVAFPTFHREVLEPAVRPGVAITHLVFEGLDGYRSIVELRDVLADDVLLADRLDGEPLTPDHGAPLRLVSPQQYGFVSTKHLCRIELHTEDPGGRYHPSPLIHWGLQLVKPHRRARVWNEERHRFVPGRLIRPVYHRLVPPIRKLSARTSR